MPELEITQDGLTDRHTLFEVEAIMLWPTDEEARKQSINFSARKDALEQLKNSDMTFSGPEVAEIVQLYWDTPTAQQMQDKATGPTKHGLTAGMLLEWLVASARAGQPMSLEDGAQRVERALHSYRVGYKTIRGNAWPNYRDVAHLWAAHTSMQTQGATPFPCAMKDLPKFLAIAEAFRTEGEALRLPRSQKTALDPNRTWRVPGNLVLPRVTLGDPVQG
jgi:hypothetical protein